MFWKMLKSDLKQKKGLSIVLFLFITVASVLVFVGGVQIYQFFTGSERNDTACKSSDMIVYNPRTGPKKDDFKRYVEKAIDHNPNVAGKYKREVRRISSDCVDFPAIDESKIDSMKYAEHYLMTMPKEGDLVFSLDDQPFAVENGTVWVSEKLRETAFADVGQMIRITTDYGNTYALTIAGFYKQPYATNYNKWYIVSDGDYEKLSEEILNPVDLYGVKFKTKDTLTFINISEELSRRTVAHATLQNAESSDSYILGYILAIFIALISLFFILIVIMTIRFTMIAAIKDEEREIGMLRAIGADSVRFRWLFAAKYIFFAVIGGIIGIIAGIPLSKIVLSAFTPGNIMPSIGEIIIIGILSVIFIVALIVGFSLLVMKRINKISVVSAIRGENRAEKFGSGKGMLLHKRKKMSPSFYLACSDLTKRFKRYAFLLVAYTLGALIILFAVNIKNSVITPDFLKYSLIYQADFFTQFTDEQIKRYSDKITKENAEIWDLVNEDIKSAGIAAHVDAEHYTTLGKMARGNGTISTSIYWGSGDISKLSYHVGTVPIHENEAALSWSASQSLGIMLGDEIELTIPYNTKDHKHNEKKAKFKVTAFVNAMDGGVPIALIGKEFDLPASGKTCMAMIIDGSNKNEVISQLKATFGEHAILTGQEYTRMVLIEYSNIFDMLEYAVGSAVLFILILMTYLYASVFIAEEKSETAFMKSIGFMSGTIKAAHIFRTLILSVISVIIGEILLRTLGQFIVGTIMDGLGITGFGLLPEFFMSFIAVPVLIMAAVLLTQWLSLRKIDKIDILNMKDE